MRCFCPVIEPRTSILSDALSLCPIASRTLTFIVKISAIVKHTVFLQQCMGEAVSVPCKGSVLDVPVMSFLFTGERGYSYKACSLYIAMPCFA